jgi:hypothetical protein
MRELFFRADVKPIPTQTRPATRSARGVLRRASQWLASAPHHPLEGGASKRLRADRRSYLVGRHTKLAATIGTGTAHE